MNKTQLIEKVAAGAGLKKDVAKKAVEAALGAVKEALAADDKVALIGFGTFSVVTRPAHEGLNPSNMEKIQIPEKKVVKFKAGAELNAGL